MRSRLSRPKKENLYKASLQTKLKAYDSESPADDFSRERSDQMDDFDNTATVTSRSVLSKLNPFKRKQSQQPQMFEKPPLRKRHSLAPGTEMDPSKYLQNTMSGRASLSGLSSSRHNLRRPSLFMQQTCLEEEQDVLENTTIADLIRAIESAHTENVVSSETFGTDDDTKSNERGRKAGNSSPFAPPHHQSLLTINGRPPYSRGNTIHGPSSDIMPMKVSKAAPKRLNSLVSMLPDENTRGGILGDASPFVRRLSFRPPPPYTSSPSPTPSNDFSTSSLQNIKPALKRRFSVRPSNLEQAPGQFHKTSIGSAQNLTGMASHSQQQSSSGTSINPFTRRLSWRPTPSTLAQSNDTKDKKEAKK